MRIKALN